MTCKNLAVISSASGRKLHWTSWRLAGALLALPLLGMTTTSAFAATAPSTSSVLPISVPDTVNGQSIATGYAVGESIIYPSVEGYSILANPNIAWTTASKLAYVQNHQALKDLLTFAASPYSQSPEAQQAGPINVAQINGTLTRVSPTPNIALYGFNHYTFNDSQYFNVNGNSEGGFLSDASVLTMALNLYRKVAYPSGYLGWRPNTSVIDLVGTPVSVSLNVSWKFSGVTLGLTYPLPSVSSSSNGGSWSSGRQPTWDYTWLPTQQPIYANPTVYDLLGTSETMMGTINVRQSDGAITGTSGTHTISWGIKGFSGNN